MCESTISAEVLAGTGLSLAKAARHIPPFRNNKPTSPSTIYRWIAVGVTLANGMRLRLEAIRLGGRWLTSTQAIERFILAQTPKFDETPIPSPRTTTQRAKAAERAGRQLDDLF